MMRRLLVLITFLNLMTSAAYGSDICFEHIDISSGLSQNTVQAIIQDGRGFIWFGTKDGLNRYDGRHFKVFRHIPGTEDGLGNNQVRCLAEDPSGDIWVGTNSGLYIYDSAAGTFRNMPIMDASGKVVRNTILQIRKGPDDTMWIAVERLGVFRWKHPNNIPVQVLSSRSPIRTLEIDQATGTIWFSWSGNGLFYTNDGFATHSPYLLENGSKIFPEDIISSILISGFNRIYLGLEGNGLVELNRATRKIRQLKLADYRPFVRNIMQYSPEELWVGTESGIFIWNITEETSEHLEYSPSNKWSLSDNAIHSIFKDRDAGIWIGTFFGGINYLPQRTPDFRKFYYNGAKDCFTGRRVRRICPDGKGRLWVASEDAGLFSFNPADGRFHHFAPSRNFSNIQTILPDSDELWIGTFSKGIKVLNTRTSEIRSYKFVKNSGPRLFSNNIFALAKSSSGRIYVGTMHGLQYYDKEIDGFGYVPEINGGKMVNDILEDSKGNLWVGTLSNGLYLLRNGSTSWEQFVHDSADKHSIPGNNINSIFEDSKGNLWFTTYGSGLCRWNPDNKDFTTFDTQNGLPSNVIYQITEDGMGNFWIASNNGLILFDPADYTIEKVFTTEDGLLSNQFNGNSFCQDNNGNIYSGCIEGMISFNPMKLHWKASNEQTPDIYLTEFLVSDYGGSPLEKDITCTESIILKHNQNTFSLQIASITFSENSRLIFQMQGLDNSFREYDGGLVTYSNLPPGDYVFCVKFRDYPESDKELNIPITIRPPWWKSAPAMFIYCILLASLLVLAAYLIHRQQVNKRKEYIKAFEIAKEREVYNTKITFFTNVTHEIRTPLTLIKGPLDNILSKEGTDPAMARDLNIMKRNTDRLLVLVNQLLDFQRIEKEHLQFDLSRENIPELLEEVLERFTDLMTYQNKECTIEIRNRDIFAMVNKESMTKIISNLLSNAMKYSDSKIGILLYRDGTEFRLVFSNDGPVVPMEKRSEIFTAFYRYTNSSTQAGTGIGLYLSKSLAELQNGKLEMTGRLDENEFMLRMPLSEEPDTADSPIMQYGMQKAAYSELEIPEGLDTENTIILVVEDDRELCNFVKNALGEKWTTLAAHDGKEALDILEKENINLIVSDIMMPVMDGIELCKLVRSDIRFTHIPLILLTAKTTLESKIESMNAGADAYVEKPFSLPYLISVIANQLKTRQHLREAFLRNPLSSMNTVEMSSRDSEFLSRLQEVVNDNLNNPKFRMDDIAEMLNMSRANFYRKIKGVLDMSPNDYLKLERLRKAAKLLAEKDLQISEVSYMVGFGSPSYFAKCFHNQFGMHPKSFVSNLQKNSEQAGS